MLIFLEMCFRLRMHQKVWFAAVEVRKKYGEWKLHATTLLVPSLERISEENKSKVYHLLLLKMTVRRMWSNVVCKDRMKNAISEEWKRDVNQVLPR